jgi:hypothetical protein
MYCLFKTIFKMCKAFLGDSGVEVFPGWEPLIRLPCLSCQGKRVGLEVRAGACHSHGHSHRLIRCKTGYAHDLSFSEGSVGFVPSKQLTDCSPGERFFPHFTGGDSESKQLARAQS